MDESHNPNNNRMNLDSPLQLLGDRSPRSFVDEYWQRKPLIVRNALPSIQGMIDADSLAGLALEEVIESRIIRHEPKEQLWTLEHGPFTEQQLIDEAQENWTLLVQGVNQHLTEWHLLLDQFTFIPNWRVDDIMLSYAVDGGSVGPHFDNYDVFLIQVSGQRRWLLGPAVEADAKLLPHASLSLLESMEVETEYVLNPGDLLYVPPKVPHHGISLGECITASVGFRAPSASELTRQFADHAAQIGADDGVTPDADYVIQAEAGWINPSKLTTIQDTLIKTLSDKALFEHWFGQYISQPKNNPDEPLIADEADLSINQDIDTDLITKFDRTIDENPDDFEPPDFLEQLHTQPTCLRDENVTLVFTGPTQDQPTAFFINGKRWPIPTKGEKLVVLLCRYRQMDSIAITKLLPNPSCERFFSRLCRLGFFYFPD